MLQALEQLGRFDPWLARTPKRQVAGYYPEAYRITYDAETNEYRVALTRLTWQQ